MAFRMWRKAILLSLREKKIFTVFTLIYTILIFLTSLFWNLALTPPQQGGMGEGAYYLLLIFFGTSLFLSLLYAWILVSRKRRVWATLKCIGYTNKNILVLVSGMIFFTTIIGFFVVIEVLFHYTAALTYLQIGNPILIQLIPVIVTSALFILVQIFAFILAYRKVLKVRPIIALKKIGE
ncbi:MAG: FtsX-like permease family protein [Promethearchaeota archaeon]